MNQEDIAQAVTSSQTMAIIELLRAFNAVKQAMMHLADLGIESENMQGVSEYLTQQITNLQEMRFDTFLW